VQRLSESGVRVGVNIVLSRWTFLTLEETVDAAVAHGAQEVHLLRLKPAGRETSNYLTNRLTPEQAMQVWPRIRTILERHSDLSVRVDCAMTPFLAAHGVDPVRMRDFGWTGCHGGDALVSVRADGRRTPCSFVDDEVSPALVQRWRRGVEVGTCASCEYQPICRGGCHAVATHVGGEPFLPDPECPRVLAAAGA
jgi:radical SAM protein with 4Fe4S-binding SPASM domain